MASFFTTGPALIYIGLKTGYFFLGTGREPPHFRIRRGWIPIFNDLQGPVIPSDVMYAAQEALTIVDMNRYDPVVMATIRSMPNVTGSAGTNVFGDIGTLMITEGAAFTLVLNYPYAALKPAMRAAGLVNNVIFPGTWLEGPDDEDQGTTDKKINLIFHSLPVNGRLAYSAALPLPPPT
jgi:hypothetical protein